MYENMMGKMTWLEAVRAVCWRSKSSGKSGCQWV